MHFRHIAILGPGLLGGSIALGALARGFDGSLRLWARREEAVEEIRSRMAPASVLATSDLEQALVGADLVVFCTPVEAMGSLAQRCRPFLQPHTVLTDVGSVKCPVLTEVRAGLGGTGFFVGSHPMAGSEQGGIAFASPDLFENAVCIVTPDPAADPAALAAVEQFWIWLGMEIRHQSPGEHDRTVALVSHLPHAIAAALVNLVCAGHPDRINFCGNGFLDTTRIASGLPGLWAGIFHANKEEVIASLDGLEGEVRRLRHWIESGACDQVAQYLSEAKQRRDTLKASRTHGSN